MSRRNRVHAALAEIGQKIRTRRDELTLTQQDLSYEAGVGRSSITNIEAGNQAIQVDTLMFIAEGLDCRVVDLLPDDWSN